MILGLFFAVSVSISDIGSDGQEPRVVYQRETVIDFDTQDVEGRIVGPDGVVIIERRIASFNPLITLRADFNDLLSQSVEEVK